MPRLLRLVTARAVWLLAVFLLASLPSAAEKITVDPNTVKAEKKIQPITDKRLDQKITYESLDQRLHSVLEDLSRQTGVEIRCGDSKNDWQVRDLPLVVCARDLPLGKLLRAIADSTHLLMTSSKNGKGERVYRIWRDKARKRQMEDYLSARDAAALARANWEWDTWARLGQTPGIEEAAKQIERASSNFDPASSIMFAKIMSTLSANDREQAFRDGELRLSVRDQSPDIKTALLEFQHASWEWWREENAQHRRMLSNLEPDVYARMYPNGETDAERFPEKAAQSACLVLHVSTKEWGGVTPCLEASYSSGSTPANLHSEWVRKCLKNWPDEPQLPHEPENLSDKAKPNWDCELLQTRLNVERPKDKKTATFADCISAISRSADVSIISEDYVSQKESYGDPFADLTAPPSSGVIFPLGQTLRNMMGWLELYRVDEASRLITASASDWVRHHDRLVPESFLKDLGKKLTSTGAELDDVVSMISLSDGQRDDWILGSLKLKGCQWWASEFDKPFWQLYDSLGADDKARAKSEDGLKLSELDLTVVTVAFSEATKAPVRGQADDRRRRLESNPALYEELERILRETHPELFSNPESIPEVDRRVILEEVAAQIPELSAPLLPTDSKDFMAITLRVHKEPVKRVVPPGYKHDPSRKPAPMPSDLLERSRYHMTLDWPDRSLKINGPGLLFPAYSPQREAELWQEKAKAASKNTSETTK